MRILISSPAFLPNLGGLELNVAQLARELTRAGHEVVVLTNTPSRGVEDQPFRVLRKPSAAEKLHWLRWCEVFHQPNLSLRNAWPLLFKRRPWVVSHHSWYCQSDGRIAWRDRIKRFLLRFADGSIAVSSAVAADLDTPCVVIPNSYRSELFQQLAGVPRDRDLVFLGRLVSDKGVDVLLDSLVLLREQGWEPNLTIIGSGPEEAPIRDQVLRSKLEHSVTFAGSLTGKALVESLNRHAVLVVPSRYAEPFGIVALEGIACGCVVVGSNRGGLPEAIGPCGLTFPNGDAASLAAVLLGLRQPDVRRNLLTAAPAHLALHQPAGQVGRFIDVFRQAARDGGLAERGSP